MINDKEREMKEKIDEKEEYEIEEEMERRGWKIDLILKKNKNIDNVEGNEKMKEKLGVRIIGKEEEKEKIKGIERKVKGGEEFKLGILKVKVI